MIWGYDYSMQLFVNLGLLVIILSTVFIKQYIELKKHKNEDELINNLTKK